MGPLAYLPEIACGAAALGVLARRRDADDPATRSAALGGLILATAGCLLRAPGWAWSADGPELLGGVGAPGLVLVALWIGADVARGRRSACWTELGGLLLLGAALLRIATWPSGRLALYALGGVALGWALLLLPTRGRAPGGVLGAALVASAAGLAPFAERLVHTGHLPSVALAWAGAGLALAGGVCALALSLRAAPPRATLLALSLAQLGLLFASAAVTAQHSYGALVGAAWAWLTPLLALWALLSGLEEDEEATIGLLGSNRPQRIAAGVALLALCGAPLTPGFAARASLADASLRAGLALPTLAAGVALLALALSALRLVTLAARPPREPREPWVFDHRAARVACLLPWALVASECVRPGLFAGGHPV